QLNATSQGIQSLRANAEAGINDSVNTANNALQQIARLNVQLHTGIGEHGHLILAVGDGADVHQLRKLRDVAIALIEQRRGR
ncbi:hypothetical protein FNJ47_48390, partial [Bradyrhizobium sp. UFLA 03-164]|nr:hypothetical protein [Bradyrhizobium uaiense]